MSDASTQPPPAGPSTLEADLRATAAACVDVVWAQDRERRITYISPGVAALTGYPPEQYRGRRLHELPWVRLMPGVIDQARAAFAAHRPYRDRRLTVTHRDGRQLVLAVAGQPVFDAAGAFQGYRGIAVEITETVRSETIFQRIATLVRNHVGEAYLQALVRALAEELGVERAFVGRTVGEQCDRIRVIAAHGDGGPAANAEYALADTPCLGCVEGRVSLHPSGVGAQFPDARMLVEHGIEAYCGLPLLDIQGQPIGLLVVASTAPFKEPDLVCAVLQVFTGRAALEIERQAAEALLRQRQELLVESQRLGKLGYTLFDHAANRVRWSDTLFELRRLPPRDFLTFEESMQFVHPEDLPGFQAALTAAIGDRRRFEAEIRVLRGDGTVGWERRISVPRYDDRGNFTGVLSVVLDITETRSATEALKRREADLRAIMDNAPFMIFLKDRDGRYRLANRAYADWLGKAASDFTDRTVDDLLPQSLTEELKNDDRAVLEHGATIMREFAPAQIGYTHGPKYLLFTKFPIRDDLGTIVGLAGFAYDVTQRKQAEDALRASEERFRALIEYSNDMVLIARPDGTAVYRSPSSARVIQFTEDEVIGTSIFDRVHPDDVESFTQAFRAVVATPDGVASGRCRVRRKDGAWRHMTWSARNAIGVPAVGGVILNSRDVTAAVELEEQLRQAQKMEAIGQLAGGIAHDFNNIIGAILGFAGFLVEDLADGSEERRYAERIIGASHKAKDLVEHILAFSRRSSVERQPQDVAALVGRAEGLLRAALPSSTALALRSAPEPLIVNVNTVQIDQVLLNLCVNANDALGGDPGTISVTVDRVDPAATDGPIVPGDEDAAAGPMADRASRVTAGSLHRRTPYARITVSDTGTGMSPEVLARIFDPFFTTKERGRGTGLGLSIVHGVVMDYGGACCAESAPGRGTTFRVYLPLDARPASSTGTMPRPADMRGDERVLVVEDEADIADILVIGLSRLGYLVTAIRDPLAAVAAFEQNPDQWDIVISDQVMPGMKGMALFARLKAIKPGLRFVLCTGFSDGATELHALEAGIDAFFTKPVSPELLAARIRDILAAKG